MIRVELKDIEFTYDFFQTYLPSGDVLTINKVDESFLQGDTEEIFSFYNFVIQVFETNETLQCSSVIGTSNAWFSILSYDKSDFGNVLTKENITNCYMEILDD